MSLCFLLSSLPDKFWCCTDLPLIPLTRVVIILVKKLISSRLELAERFFHLGIGLELRFSNFQLFKHLQRFHFAIIHMIRSLWAIFPGDFQYFASFRTFHFSYSKPVPVHWQLHFLLFIPYCPLSFPLSLLRFGLLFEPPHVGLALCYSPPLADRVLWSSPPTTNLTLSLIPLHSSSTFSL